MLAAPIALLLLTYRWTWLLATISVAMWMANLLLPGGVHFGWSVENNGTFHLAAWQLIFFAGMALGHHRARLAQIVRADAYPVWIGASAFGCVLLLILFVVGMRGSEPAANWLFGKPHLGPGRFIASAVVFTFAFLSVHTLWVPLRRALGWLLLPLGQHALYAYTAHVLLGLALVSAEAQTGYFVTDSRAVNAVLQSGAIGIVWLGIRYRVFLRAQDIAPVLGAGRRTRRNGPGRAEAARYVHVGGQAVAGVLETPRRS